jgi:septal ring factor EnvC (AmiA/AmiB activator)
MSSTMVMTMATTTTLSTDALACCPSCGLPAADQTQTELLRAQARIAELETQVRLLNEKATAAVDRWADYEDELSKLRQAPAPTAPPLPPKDLGPPPDTSPTRTSFLQAGTNRLSQLLYPRSKSVSAASLQPPDSPSQPSHSRGSSGPLSPTTASAAPNADDLLEALTREKSLRKEAEGRLTDSSREIEELSAALFEQANEMVADERRARAKLEERVGELERRDAEKRRRLERLEKAMHRIERVRGLLNEDNDGAAVGAEVATSEG